MQILPIVILLCTLVLTRQNMGIIIITLIMLIIGEVSSIPFVNKYLLRNHIFSSESDRHYMISNMNKLVKQIVIV